MPMGSPPRKASAVVRQEPNPIRLERMEAGMLPSRTRQRVVARSEVDLSLHLMQPLLCVARENPRCLGREYHALDRICVLDGLRKLGGTIDTTTDDIAAIAVRDLVRVETDPKRPV